MEEGEGLYLGIPSPTTKDASHLQNDFLIIIHYTVYIIFLDLIGNSEINSKNHGWRSKQYCCLENPTPAGGRYDWTKPQEVWLDLSSIHH